MIIGLGYSLVRRVSPRRCTSKFIAVTAQARRDQSITFHAINLIQRTLIPHFSHRRGAPRPDGTGLASLQNILSSNGI